MGYDCRFCRKQIGYVKAVEMEMSARLPRNGTMCLREIAEHRVKDAIEAHHWQHATGDLRIPVELLVADPASGLLVATDWMQAHGWHIHDSVTKSIKRGGGVLDYVRGVKKWVPWTPSEFTPPREYPRAIATPQDIERLRASPHAEVRETAEKWAWASGLPGTYTRGSNDG